MAKLVDAYGAIAVCDAALQGLSIPAVMVNTLAEVMAISKYLENEGVTSNA